MNTTQIVDKVKYLAIGNMKITSKRVIRDFKINKPNFKTENPLILVRVLFKYPDYEPFIKLKPKKRIKAIAKVQRQKIKKFKAFLSIILPEQMFKIKGTKKRPYAVDLWLTFDNMKKVAEFDEFEYYDVLLLKGVPMKKKNSIKQFYSVLVRNIILEEGIRKGKQGYEDVIFFVFARSFEAAIRKARKFYKEREIIYLSSSGRLVNWKFEKVLDCYQTGFKKFDRINQKDGDEIFSRLKDRTLKTKQVWKKQWN